MATENQVIAELARLFQQPKVKTYAERTEVTIGKETVRLLRQSTQTQKQTGLFG